jgi:hypothetical protein
VAALRRKSRTLDTTVDEVREALRQQGIVVPEIYQLEYHDPAELEAIEKSYEAGV